MTTKHKFTQGKWLITDDELTIANENNTAICYVENILNNYKESQANAQLIADAGTTANKCGLLPSELLEQRDELLKAAQAIYFIAEKCNNAMLPSHTQELLKEIETELAKAIKKATL